MMTQLKTLFIIIMLFASSNSFSQKKNSLPVFTAQLDGWHKADSLHRYYLNDTTTYLHVKTSIKNTSPDTLCYLIMTCSWDGYYIIDSKYLNFGMRNCWYNYLTAIKIPPYKTHERLLLLNQTHDQGQLQNTKFRVGFKLYTVNLNEANKDIDLGKYENPKNEKILWSNTLELK